MSELTSVGQDLKEVNVEAFNKLSKAMELSKGKVNNIVGIVAALSEKATVEDIIRLADMDDNTKVLRGVFRSRYDDKVWRVKNGRTKEEVLRKRIKLREDKFHEGFSYTIKDTYLYRTMQKIGFKTDLDEEKEYGGCLHEYSVCSKYKYATKLSDSCYANSVMMYYHAPKDLRDIVLNDANLSELWEENGKIQKQIHRPYSDKEVELHPVTISERGWRRFQIEHIVKEFDQIAHMPKSLKEKMVGWMENEKNPNISRYYNRKKLPPIIMHTILEGFKYPAEDKNIELVEEAFSVMEYIGIGVCWNYVKCEQFDTNPDGSIKYDANGKEIYKDVYRTAMAKEIPYKVGAMLKHISSVMRVFASDVKKGFNAADVRELIVEDLNAWSNKNAREHWKFFVRDDAKTEYPDLQKKKKTNKKADMELNDKELEVIKMYKKENGGE